MAEIETLYDAFEQGVAISMRCAHGRYEGLKRVRDCQYRKQLDIETLLCTRGPNFPIGRLSERLMCPRCKSMRVAVSISMPRHPDEQEMARRVAAFSGRY